MLLVGDFVVGIVWLVDCVSLSGSMSSFTYCFSFLWASEDCSIKDLGMGTTEGPTTGKDEDWLCSPAVF